MASLTPDPKKRDYLLPPGCKDLIDVLKLGESRDSRSPGAANSSNLEVKNEEASGGLDEIAKYVRMVFESTALSASLSIEPPGPELTISLHRIPGGIISATAWVQEDTPQEMALREFLATHKLPVPARTPPWKQFLFPGLPIYPSYDLMPAPVDAACLAQRVVSLLRHVCDLAEDSGLLFHYSQVQQSGEGLS
jgi:hypothetical protein